jgi:hypothetical protein
MPITNINDHHVKQRRTMATQVEQANVSNSRMHKLVAALPIAATNLLAVYFQFRFAQAALGHRVFVSVLFSVTLETIAISIAYHSHLARLSNLRSGSLRLASIFVALGIATLNASHEISASLALAATAFLCSAISPWLWAIYTTQISSPALVRAGILDPAPIRLGMDRWIYHPIKSWQVKRASSWDGTRNLRQAISAYEAKQRDKAINRAAEQSRNSLDSATEDNISAL